MTPTQITLPDRPRILVARTDRIGDAVLSLPVFASIRAAYPQSHIAALTREYTRPLFEGRGNVDEVISFDSQTSHIPLGSFARLLGEVRRGRFDAAVALFSNFSVGALLFAALIPVRIGPASKAAQVFFTHKMKQSRSKGRRHEADHNLDLLKPLGIPPLREARMTPPASKIMFHRTEGRPLVGVHPGYGGSARNWPEENWARLIARLLEEDAEVVVTGSSAERELVERIVRKAGGGAMIYTGAGGLLELAAALSRFDVFVAPSTGPLHLASAVGTPVVGIYCPIFVCLPDRWGPIGPGDTVFTPDVPPCERCAGEKCEYWDCMEMIDTARVTEEVLEKARRVAGSRAG